MNLTDELVELGTGGYDSGEVREKGVGRVGEDGEACYTTSDTLDEGSGVIDPLATADGESFQEGQLPFVVEGGKVSRE